MSHTTSLKNLVIKDIGALNMAVTALQAKGIKCSLEQNVAPRMYYKDQHGKCPFVLKLHDSAYDVGFDAQPDGSYVPVMDDYGNHIRNQIGAACPVPREHDKRAMHAAGQFFQEYARAATINAAVAQGYSVQSSVVDDEGNVHLTIAV